MSAQGEGKKGRRFELVRYDSQPIKLVLRQRNDKNHSLNYLFIVNEMNLLLNFSETHMNLQIQW
jgi:hypothetical protein